MHGSLFSRRVRAVTMSECEEMQERRRRRIK